jgi:hypothetical protein
VRACQDDELHGNLAGLILFWITGGDNAPERLEIADQILNETSADPRRAKVYDILHRLAAGAITWDEFAKVTKKGLIPKAPPQVPVPPPEAVALAAAKETLEAMLAEAGEVSPDLVWRTFTEFARLPVSATPPLYVENDMCLFQWGVYDWGEGRNFECDFTRQFVVHDSDGDYDHMEQLSLTMLLDREDPDLANLGSGDLWSADDLDNWIQQVERLEVLRVVSTKSPQGVRLQHYDV